MNTASTPRMSNTLNKSCALCADLNRVYHSASNYSEARVAMPMAQGVYSKSFIGPDLSLSYVDIKFSQAMHIDGIKKTPGDKCGLMFCLHGGMHWETWEEKREHHVVSGGNCLLTPASSTGRSFFDEGSQITSLGVSFNKNYLAALLRRAGVVGPEKALQQDKNGLHAGLNSPGIRSVLSDIVGCRFSGCLRGMYLESKIMELFTVYFAEVLLENGRSEPKTGLSKEHVERLHKARLILDADVANAPTLSALARMSGLNEYRLKTGFKELFGLPVHAYVIDKRLETARRLLEQEKLRVTEAAQMVGYSELGQFAGKFKRKFGMTPSEFAKNS